MSAIVVELSLKSNQNIPSVYTQFLICNIGLECRLEVTWHVVAT